MDFDARIKALARLAESTTESAVAALAREFEAAKSRLAVATDYQTLEEALAIFQTIGFRFSEGASSALESFVERIGTRRLTYSQQEKLLGASLEEYRNSSSLILRAIPAFMVLRYLETRRVMRALLRLSLHEDKAIRKKAIESLEELSEYNISVFYGEQGRPGIGATPQQQIVEELQSTSDQALTQQFPGVLATLRSVLSPSMEGTAWSYNTLKISRTSTPAIAPVSEVRLRAIELLKRAYELVPKVEQKLHVLSALVDATRTERGAPREAEFTSMFARDAKNVLGFFEELVETADLQVVQKVEHHSYWIFFHAITEEVREAALRVEAKLTQHTEYQFYRVLVGFEGIFGDWKQWHAAQDKFAETERHRRETARHYVSLINADNYEEWRFRVLLYAKTESNDLATFPIFYEFLAILARERPPLALKLVSEDTKAMASFLIPMLSGLWDGPEQTELLRVIRRWMDESTVGHPQNLFASVKMFLSTKALDLQMLKALCAKASEIGDTAAVREVIEVVVARFDVGGPDVMTELLFPAIRFLTEQQNANWVNDIWYRREARELFASLGPDGLDLLLGNLAVLPKIDYHAEEVLFLIAERAPEKVVDFFVRRMADDTKRRDKKSAEDFEAIPYEFHKLQTPLSRVAQTAVGKVRGYFDTDPYLFEFRGARLLHNIFPQSSEDFESELRKTISHGSETDFEFVLDILRNYRGEEFVRILCKDIVRAMPADSPLRTHVAIALETTGVVTGEFGMAEAYERKQREVSDWLEDPDEKVRDFAKWYVQGLESMSKGERRRAEEDITLRKFRYGEE
jgi:hypothetical protein